MSARWTTVHRGVVAIDKLPADLVRDLIADAEKNGVLLPNDAQKLLLARLAAR